MTDTNDMRALTTTCKHDPGDDWDHDAHCVLPSQPATYVFRNPYGQVVIRQKCWPDEDMFVMVAPEGVAALIDALRDAAGIDQCSGTLTPPRPTSARRSPAADRQARHRERKRAAATGEPPANREAAPSQSRPCV